MRMLEDPYSNCLFYMFSIPKCPDGRLHNQKNIHFTSWGGGGCVWCHIKTLGTRNFNTGKTRKQTQMSGARYLQIRSLQGQAHKLISFFTHKTKVIYQISPQQYLGWVQNDYSILTPFSFIVIRQKKASAKDPTY